MQTVSIDLPVEAAARLEALRADPGCAALVHSIHEYLARCALTGVHLVSAPPSFLTVSHGGADFSAWLHELRIEIQILTDRIDELTDTAEMADVERNVLITAFEAHRLVLEREEEAVIMRAAAVGIAIERRPDADPRAVIGVIEIDANPLTEIGG